MAAVTSLAKRAGAGLPGRRRNTTRLHTLGRTLIRHVTEAGTTIALALTLEVFLRDFRLGTFLERIHFNVANSGTARLDMTHVGTTIKHGVDRRRVQTEEDTSASMWSGTF